MRAGQLRTNPQQNTGGLKHQDPQSRGAVEAVLPHIGRERTRRICRNRARKLLRGCTSLKGKRSLLLLTDQIAVICPQRDSSSSPLRTLRAKPIAPLSSAPRSMSDWGTSVACRSNGEPRS